MFHQWQITHERMLGQYRTCTESRVPEMSSRLLALSTEYLSDAVVPRVSMAKTFIRENHNQC